MCSSIVKDTWFTICLTCILLPLYAVGEVIAVYKQNQSWLIDDMESNFGTRIGSDGLMGFLDLANPIDACGSIPKRSSKGSIFKNVTISAFVLIRQGGCDYGIKVFNAQQAKYDGAVVYNQYTDNLISMYTDLEELSEQIYIPSVFVGLTNGIELKTSFLHKKGIYPYVQLFSNGDPLSLKYYIVPFCIVLGTCTLAMVGFFFVKYLRNRHRQRRNRLSRQRLKQLPVKVFTKGDEYDVCAICLDDYEEGEKLRVLPCNHAYHCTCVDPWLTSSKRVCPLCKRRVLSDDETSTSGSEYDDDDTVSDTSEEAHLLQNSSAASPNAARFATGFSTRNPFRRNYGADSWSSATTAEPSSSVASNIPSSSGHHNRGETLMPSVMRDNELSPEFYVEHENLPNQLAALADRWPESSPVVAEVSSSLLCHLSSGGSSSRSGDGTPLRSYVVDPDEYTVIESTPSDLGPEDVITIADGAQTGHGPPVV